MRGASGPDRRLRSWALAGYGLATLLAFPHELPGGLHALTGGSSVDLGLVFAWLVPAALAIGIEGQAPRAAARTAFLASLVTHAVFFHWFMIVTLVYGGMPFWLGVFAPLAPSLYVSLFTALFAGLFAWVGRRAASPVLVGALLWVAVDWLRGHFLGGFPWATLGYALHRDPFLVPLTAWTGVYGLSFVAAAVGLALAGRVLGWTPRAGRALALTLVAVGLAHGLGAIVAVDAPAGSTAGIRIAAIQGNIDQSEKWDSERRTRILDTYLRLSEQAAEAGASWIVWPETAVPGLLQFDSELRDRVGALARRHGVTLVVGGMGADVDRAARRYTAFYDSAFLVDRTGVIRDRYDKTHLVPFGEYVPLRDLLGRFFQALARGLSATDVTAGPAPRNFEVTGGVRGESIPVGVPICYELLFPHLVRQFGEQGAELLLAITNDAWYGRTGAPHQFLAMTALRAAESGLPVVRAANTGISAIIDAQGRVVEVGPLFEEAVVIGEVARRTGKGPTFYARFGDGFAGLCLVAVIGLTLRRGFVDRRKRRKRPLESDADGNGTSTDASASVGIAGSDE